MKLLKTAVCVFAITALSAAVWSAPRLSDLVDPALTQSEAIPEWATGETYQPGTERTAENPDALDENGDPTVFIWQMSDDVEHTASATWDAAERDHWRALGAYVTPSAEATNVPTATVTQAVTMQARADVALITQAWPVPFAGTPQVMCGLNWGYNITTNPDFDYHSTVRGIGHTATEARVRVLGANVLDTITCVGVYTP